MSRFRIKLDYLSNQSPKIVVNLFINRQASKIKISTSKLILQNQPTEHFNLLPSVGLSLFCVISYFIIIFVKECFLVPTVTLIQIFLMAIPFLGLMSNEGPRDFAQHKLNQLKTKYMPIN